MLLGGNVLAQEPRRIQTLAEMYHSSWTIRSGAPSSIEAIAQTQDGYLWIGTDTGLFRFDGRAFERYHPASGEDILTGTVQSLLASRDGGLWISYGFPGASFLKQGHNVNFGKAEGLTSGSISHFAQDRKGTIWAAGNTALLRLEGAHWVKTGQESGYPADHAASVFVDNRGTVWAGTGKQLLYLKADAKQFVIAREMKDEGYSLADAPDGAVWVSTPHLSQVEQLTDASGRLTPGSHVLRYRAKKILFDKGGSLWISTDDRGLYRLAVPQTTAATQPPGTEGAVQHFSALQGLTGDNTYDLAEDREGSLWVASTKGLDQFRPAALTGVPLPENWFRIGIVADGPDSILAAGKGIVHIGPAGVVREKGELKQIACAYRDPQGEIWLGEDDGLWRYTPSGLVAVPLPEEVDPLFHIAQAITMDRAGGLWVSFLHSGFMYFQHGRWTKPSFPTASVHDPGLFAYTDSQGRVWFGLKDSRVEVLSGSDHVRYGAESGLHVGDVTGIYERAGQVWVGGQAGLAFEKGGQFQELHLEGDAVLEGVSGITQTNSGELWVNQASGILRVAADEVKRAVRDPEYRVRFLLYNYLDGLTDTASQIRPNPTVVETSSGRLYFASRTGVVWIDPDRLENNTVPPNVFVQSIAVGGKPFALSDEVRLPVHASAIEIDFAATSLLIPERVRFRYKLEGFDESWQDAGTRRQAFYSGLPPGRYRFHVMASNNDGIWNESGATVEFQIPPSFLQSISFKALCATLAFTLLASLYRFRVRLVTNRVKTRLYERLAERERIARDLHDTFFQGIQGLLLRFNTATAQLDKDEPARIIFEETLNQSDQVMLEGRDLVLDLRTGSSEISSLSEAFSIAGAELRKLREVDFRVLVHGEARALHPIVFEEAYRLGKEALVNAFRHSQANLIEAELNYETTELRIRFRDNGVGIDAKVLTHGGRERHWGLPGMRERAQKIGAHLDFWSRKGAGTEIELRISAAVAYRTRTTNLTSRWLRNLAARKDASL